MEKILRGTHCPVEGLVFIAPEKVADDHSKGQKNRENVGDQFGRRKGEENKDKGDPDR